MCQNRSCFETLGDLFGPYFIHLNDDLTLPDVLIQSFNGESNQTIKLSKKKLKLEKPFEKKVISSNKGLTDLWFHGKCSLWAPELYLVGGKFFGLERFMKKYWSQVIFIFLIKKALFFKSNLNIYKFKK